MQSTDGKIQTCWHQMVPVLQQIGNPQPQMADETPASPKPTNLRETFTMLVSGEVKRTGFKRERIESFLPDELKQLFRNASTPGARLHDDELSRRLIDFLKVELFGILPDYNARALPEHADGFKVNGRAVQISMSRDTVSRQINALARKTDMMALTRRAEVELKGTFSPTDILSVVRSSGNKAIDRVLVAKIICIAQDMLPK